MIVPELEIPSDSLHPNSITKHMATPSVDVAKALKQQSVEPEEQNPPWKLSAYVETECVSFQVPSRVGYGRTGNDYFVIENNRDPQVRPEGSTVFKAGWVDSQDCSLRTLFDDDYRSEKQISWLGELLTIAPPETIFEPVYHTTFPHVRKCNFTTFKNLVNDEPRPAIDCLVANYTLEVEIETELKSRRKWAKVHGNRQLELPKGLESRKIHGLAGPGKSVNASPQEETSWISRIRIWSPSILSNLAKCQEETWPLHPRTFLRPFSSLIVSYHKMEETLRNLEEK